MALGYRDRGALRAGAGFSEWRTPAGQPRRLLPCTPAGSTGSSLPVELLVEKEDQEVDVYLSSIKEFHDGDAFVLELQQVLIM